MTAEDGAHSPPTAARAARLVGCLQDLRLGPLALGDIISLGDVAIGPLEAFLRGPTQSLYHPRALAADALSAIGGDNSIAALIRALRDCISRELDPRSMEAEGVVISRIVEHLGKYKCPAVIDALLDTLKVRPYPACARALGQMGDARAVPLLVHCLYEDAARNAAMESLRRSGRAAASELRAALAKPSFVHGLEPPTRIDGRVAATTLLAELGDRVSLLFALDDRQQSVRLAAALGLAALRGKVPKRAINLLLDGLADPDWARAQTIMQALIHIGPSVADPLGRILAEDVMEEGAKRRRRRAAVLTGRLGPVAATEKLAALSNARDPGLRLAAISALAQLGAADESQLARFLTDTEFAVARCAFDALQSRTEPKSKSIAHWLEFASTGQTRWKRWWQARRLSAKVRRSLVRSRAEQ
jgi:HEAT repeat protein